MTHRREREKKRQREAERKARILNEIKPEDLASKVSEIVMGPKTTSPELVETAIQQWIPEEFPLHLSISDLNQIAKRRPLRSCEIVLIHVLGFMDYTPHEGESDLDREYKLSMRARGVSLFNQMLTKNLAIQASRLRRVTRSIVPANCQPDLPIPGPQKSNFAKVDAPYEPIIRYRLNLPDNGRGPNRGK